MNPEAVFFALFPFLEALQPAWHEMMRHCELRDYAEGAPLWEENATLDRVYFLLEGSMQIEQKITEGQTDLIPFSAGAILGLNALLHPCLMEARADATTPLHTLELSHAALERWKSSSPATASLFLELVAGKLQNPAARGNEALQEQMEASTRENMQKETRHLSSKDRLA